MNDTPTLDALAARVGKLERENRRLRLAGLAALLVVAAVGLMGQTMPEERVIEADRFLIKNDNGTRKVQLNYLGLEVFDNDGQLRVQLGAPPGKGGVLVMYDENGASRAMLTASSGLGLYDENKVIRAALFNDGKLALYGANGKAVSSLP